ncbi:MAG: ATP-binding protein [Janthinobacterium lividum]
MTANEPGHHSSGGRNVISAGEAAGSDVFFAAVQMSRMPMCLTDPHGADNPILFCNQAFERLCGYTQAEIVGRNCRFLQGEGTDPAAVAEVRRALGAGEDVHLELLNYRRDGTPFWNALFISPVFDTRGRLIYHFASQLDVTRRREAEAVLQQSQRMETLGSMASSLAHEFNNLMTIVLANLDRLDGQVDGERGRRSVERATWGARRAVRLTDQMLSFARRQFHESEVLDVRSTLENCDSILDQMAGASVRVRLALCEEPLFASLDASQLEMALLNLVRNAADAAPRSGEIVVAARRRPLDALAGGPAVEVSVADLGSGMTAEVAQKAMEPFFTTKGPGKGTGLGLSMVRGFVEQSGGRLELQTVPGVGTTVRMVFPQSMEPAPA